MAEVAHAREDHCQPGRICRRNDFLVAHGPTGLHDCSNSCCGHGIEPVAEGEERVACTHATDSTSIRPLDSNAG